jgi:hypothetical protein
MFHLSLHYDFALPQHALHVTLNPQSIQDNLYFIEDLYLYMHV